MPAMPRPFATLAGTLAASLPHDPANMSLGFAARQFAQGLASTGVRRHASWLAPLVPEALASIAGPRLGAGARARAFDAVDACGVGASRPFDAATDFYLRLYLGEGVLTKVDRASMRASLEARAPLLDTGIVEFCLSLPESYRVRGHTTKWLMREAVRDLLPASIVARKKKGFGAPVGAWLRGPLRDLAEAILHPARLRDGGWLDPVGVSRMLDLHVKGVADFRKPLYAALVFEHWRQARGC
jgi:asparagine synthetase B (glutamine-hydrolysing)